MAERERPANWEDWKWLHRWPRLTSIEWALEWLVYWCKGLAIFELLEVIGRIITVASVAVAVFLWWREADERKKQNHYRAWELINSARGSTGDGGRRDALQDLNEDKVDLSAAPLAKAWLRELQLPSAILLNANLSEAILLDANLSGANLLRADLSHAFLRRADLSGANLSGADLSGAKLRRAKLSEAKLSEAKLFWADLSGAKLSGAKLSGADLRRADLFGADLSGADLFRADLSGANLSGAFPANIRNLDSAKFCKTTMPDGTLNNRDCPPEPTPPSPSETPPAPN